MSTVIYSQYPTTLALWLVPCGMLCGVPRMTCGSSSCLCSSLFFVGSGLLLSGCCDDCVALALNIKAVSWLLLNTSFHKSQLLFLRLCGSVTVFVVVCWRSEEQGKSSKSSILHPFFQSRFPQSEPWIQKRGVEQSRPCLSHTTTHLKECHWFWL